MDETINWVGAGYYARFGDVWCMIGDAAALNMSEITPVAHYDNEEQFKGGLPYTIDAIDELMKKLADRWQTTQGPYRWKDKEEGTKRTEIMHNSVMHVIRDALNGDKKREPRAKTKEEVTIYFLKHLKGLAAYWANEDGNTTLEKCEGVVFSILNIFDGMSAVFPAMDIVLRPHEEDKEYCQGRGEDWFEDGTVINDCYLHEMFYSKEVTND